MLNKSKKILSEISAGELLDKISILEIKLAKVKNKESHIEIDKEYKILKEVEKLSIETTEKLKLLFEEVKRVNQNLWDIEDKLRICERLILSLIFSILISKMLILSNNSPGDTSDSIFLDILVIYVLN